MINLLALDFLFELNLVGDNDICRHCIQQPARILRTLDLMPFLKNNKKQCSYMANHTESLSHWM